MNKKTSNKPTVPEKPPLPDTPPMAAKVKRRYFAFAGALAICLCCATPAFAAGDPLSVVNNLSDFIFSCIKAIGVIILGWGLVQVGMSVQSHDASQRTQGFLCLFGGLVIAFAKEILTAIGAV
jgi:threonine/homoserine/homoserine lactone efflux protein